MKWLYLIAFTASALAQPIVQTNIVVLTPTTRLQWSPNPEPDISGYLAEMHQGASRWSLFTTNTFVPILTLNSNAHSGSYTFSVAALNRDGLSGGAATILTNISLRPRVVVNLRIEVAIE